MKEIMNARFRMYRRQRGIFYLFDRHTNQRTSLETADESEALRLLHAQNEAHQQPLINRQIARAYLAVGDPQITRRTWLGVMTEIIKLKTGVTQARWQVASKDRAFESLRDLPVFETQPDHFLRVLERGGVSTNVYLRRIHNFALDMGWLPWPVLPKKRWPKVEYGTKRAITWDEHQRIVQREGNPERRGHRLGPTRGELPPSEVQDDGVNALRGRSGDAAPPVAAHGTALSLPAQRAGGRSRHGVQAALPRVGHQRRDAPFLSLRVGRAGEGGRLSGAFCAGGAGP